MNCQSQLATCANNSSYFIRSQDVQNYIRGARAGVCLDDLVCDLVQGHAKISVERSALSNAPLIQQKKVLDTGDLQATYLALKDQLQPSFNKEKALFTAGRVSAKLEQDRKIAILGDKKSFELLQKLMTPDMSKLSDLDSATLTCVADQMQEYTRSLMHQEMEVRLKFPSLDAIDPAQRPKL